MGKCIGTSDSQYIGTLNFPRVNDAITSPANGYNNHAGDPGYGMGPDGRQGKRRLELLLSRTEQLNSMANVEIGQGAVGRRISDGKWPFYTELIDALPDCS